MKLFITFGTDHLDRAGNSLHDFYMVVEGEDYDECRRSAFSVRGNKFAFSYGISELEWYQAKYGPMKEVSQEDARIVDQERQASG